MMIQYFRNKTTMQLQHIHTTVYILQFKNRRKRYVEGRKILLHARNNYKYLKNR